MSVNELQALAQQFADAFDQRDLNPVMEMLSEDVEVFESAFPTGSTASRCLPSMSTRSLWASYRRASASDNHRFSVYGDTVGIVNAHGSFRGVTKNGKVLALYDRGTLVFVKQGRSSGRLWPPTSPANAPRVSEHRRRLCGYLEMKHDDQ